MKQIYHPPLLERCQEIKKVKAYLHVCDNGKLSSDDKWLKLRSLYDVVNKNLIQFGVFAEHLSIDEQMAPYFG